MSELLSQANAWKGVIASILVATFAAAFFLGRETGEPPREGRQALERAAPFEPPSRRPSITNLEPTGRPPPLSSQ